MRTVRVFCCLLACLSLAGAACSFTPSPKYSLAGKLPSNVAILETFSDTTGMDAFYMVKASYTTEDELNEIIRTFHLEADPDGVSDLSFAGLFDERANISWFPLRDANRKYEFDSVNDDGTFKKSVNGSYENAMCVDDVKKIFIIQSAAK
ncbi:polyprenyl synthetase family protein [Mariniblastus fucicola]|uniref:Lipoprotein n=1 Tax=Mariniblastus fucicola TaxID=980251 RepID=A0A5B9PAK5_9BACT|nr:polyprenyl synthetase family protein [Mariniblastus fucicola]QEG21960.1 hypothetical protein MFFC18_18210 [Mariniblastus fucicola]